MPIDVRNLTPLIQIFDMAISVAFYRDVLGFEIVSRSSPGKQFDWALLRLGGASLMLNAAYEAHERPPSVDTARWAGHADTGLFFRCPGVDDAYALLRDKGVAVEQPVVRGYGMKQLYVTDPDGYVLCFQNPVETSKS